MNKVKYDEVKSGDELIADGGFHCLPAGEHIVMTTADGSPFILCMYGRHLLDAQRDDQGYLIGFTRKKV